MKEPPEEKPRIFSYDVCLSFAGEDREYVEEVANTLRGRGVRVFYDRYERAQLWGKNLYSHMAEIYGKASRFCILFVSRHYATKVWTSHERESAQARALMENQEYILPARFDDTEIPGLQPTVAYIDLRTTSPAELSSLVIDKLGDRTGQISATIRDLKPDASVPILLGMLSEHNQSIRRRAAEELAVVAESMGPGGATMDELVPALVAALADLDTEIRGSAAKALGSMRSFDAVPALIAALADADAGVRGLAATALGSSGSRSSEVVPALIAALADADPDVRRRAVESLGLDAIGGMRCSDALPALITALADVDAEVRCRAAIALGGLPRSDDAIPALVAALADSALAVRTAADMALDVTDGVVVKALATALVDCDRSDTEVFASAIGKAGIKAISPAFEALRLHGEPVRDRIQIVLQQIGPPGFPLLIEALGDRSAAVRNVAVEALGSNDPDLLGALGDLNRKIAGIQDFALPMTTSYWLEGIDDSGIRFFEYSCPELESLKALGEAGTPALLPVIKVGLESGALSRDLPGDEEINNLVKDVLKAMGPAAHKLLRLLLTHVKGYTRNTVVWALNDVYGEEHFYF